MKRFALCVLLLGCAPSLPDDMPVTSAASENAKPAPSAPIGVALHADPPLPGEDTTGWIGLESSGGHDMSGHGMSGHDMSHMDMGGMNMGAMMDGGMQHDMKGMDGGGVHEMKGMDAGMQHDMKGMKGMKGMGGGQHAP